MTEGICWNTENEKIGQSRQKFTWVYGLINLPLHIWKLWDGRGQDMPALPTKGGNKHCMTTTFAPLHWRRGSIMSTWPAYKAKKATSFCCCCCFFCFVFNLWGMFNKEKTSSTCFDCKEIHCSGCVCSVAVWRRLISHNYGLGSCLCDYFDSGCFCMRTLRNQCW